MKHAIIILIHKDLESIERLIMYFRYNCDVFIHLDKKSKLSDDLLTNISKLYNVKRIQKKYNVNWGGYSILKTELYMLNEVTKYGVYDYVHLFSGQDYPIKPFIDFYNFFEINKCVDFIQYIKIPNARWDNNSFSRFQYFYLFDILKNKTKAQKFNKQIKKIQDVLKFKRHFPFVFNSFYGGSQWFSLRMSSVCSILKYTQKHNRFLKKLKYTFAPEEIYFQTVLLNINKSTSFIIPLNKRYIRWKYENGNRPANLDVSHFKYLITSNCLFARKIENNVSNDLLNLIDKYLINDNDIQGILDNGGWIYDGYIKYKYSEQFVKSIMHLCKYLKIKSILDFGCGAGVYVMALREKGLSVDGCDANPFTNKLSSFILNSDSSLCKIIDFTEKIEIEEKYDFIFCKDVLPYIPDRKISKVFNNLNLLTKRYLLISWYVSGTHDSYGIKYNPKKEQEVIKNLQEFGFVYNAEYSAILRNIIGDTLNNKYYLFKKKDYEN